MITLQIVVHGHNFSFSRVPLGSKDTVVLQLLHDQFEHSPFSYLKSISQRSEFKLGSSFKNDEIEIVI